MPVSTPRPRSFQLTPPKDVRGTENIAKITWFTPDIHNSVIVTGTFDNWSKSVTMQRSDEIEAYVAEVHIPQSQLKQGKLMYKFVIDGEWMIDSEEPIECDPNGNVNNVFVVQLAGTLPNSKQVSKKKSCISVVMSRSSLDGRPSLDIPTFDSSRRVSQPRVSEESNHNPESFRNVSKKKSYIAFSNRTPGSPPLPQHEEKREKQTEAINIPYSRESIVELAQFILDHLDSAPYFVDPARIFLCVESCYRDFKKEATVLDAERYNLVLFLLGAARAASWFSEKQRGFVVAWTRDLSEM
ncbi:UNVERIFIED_CONTAM: hypothetical protein HDU68_012713 [Siphonaria sp. JEL0065]|nr:hypothetical protein HDU68_012713 [Siphonaria sp. JEL0065]